MMKPNMADETAKPNEPLDPRILFAAERTLLAWVRTGLALMGFGFVVARFGLFLRELASVQDTVPQHRSGFSLLVGTTFVFLGVAINIGAAAKHWSTVRRLERGESLHVRPWSLGMVVALFLGILGLVMATFLLVGLDR